MSETITAHTKKVIEFKTPKDMVNWLMDNEGLEIVDCYNRRWKYSRFEFFFKDIGLYDEYEKGIDCLHLHGTTLLTN